MRRFPVVLALLAASAVVAWTLTSDMPVEDVLAAPVAGSRSVSIFEVEGFDLPDGRHDPMALAVTGTEPEFLAFDNGFRLGPVVVEEGVPLHLELRRGAWSRMGGDALPPLARAPLMSGRKRFGPGLVRVREQIWPVRLDVSRAAWIGRLRAVLQSPAVAAEVASASASERFEDLRSEVRLWPGEQGALCQLRVRWKLPDEVVAMTRMMTPPQRGVQVVFVVSPEGKVKVRPAQGQVGWPYFPADAAKVESVLQRALDRGALRNGVPPAAGGG